MVVMSERRYTLHHPDGKVVGVFGPTELGELERAAARERRDDVRRALVRARDDLDMKRTMVFSFCTLLDALVGAMASPVDPRFGDGRRFSVALSEGEGVAEDWRFVRPFAGSVATERTNLLSEQSRRSLSFARYDEVQIVLALHAIPPVEGSFDGAVWIDRMFENIARRANRHERNVIAKIPRTVSGLRFLMDSPPYPWILDALAAVGTRAIGT